MNHGPPELFSSDSEDSEYGDFVFSGDYDEVSDLNHIEKFL